MPIRLDIIGTMFFLIFLGALGCALIAAGCKNWWIGK